VPSDESIRRELWVSMVSQLRSHLAALTVTGRLGEGKFVEATQRCEVHAGTAAGILTLRFDPVSGTGVWTHFSQRQTVGSWFLATDGVVVVDGKDLDIEFAVEHFAAKLL